VDEIRAAARASGRELSVAFDAIAHGTDFNEPELPYDLSSPALAKRCMTDGAADVRLTAALPDSKDPDWPLCVVTWLREPKDAPALFARLPGILDWMWANHKTTFTIPKTTVAEGVDAAFKAVHHVFEGKASMEKVLIKHPMN
jgi:hypothetical protein